MMTRSERAHRQRQIFESRRRSESGPITQCDIDSAAALDRWWSEEMKRQLRRRNIALSPTQKEVTP